MPKGLSMSTGVAGFASLLAALCAGAGPALAQPPARPADAAGAERELVWYTAMNTPDAAPLRKLFREKYPEVNLTVLRQPGEKIRTRILTEMRAGKFFWDVVSFNHLDIDALAQEGLLAAYASPETRSGFPGGAVDPEGRWAAIYVRQYVIGYNTRSVPRLQAPQSWEDLLQPVWKEKFAMDESDVEWYAAMLDYLGKEKGVAFRRSLARQNPQFRRGHSLLAKLLVASQRRAPLRGSAAVGGGSGAYPRARTRARAQRPRARARPGSAETALREPAARARSRSARKGIPGDISARSLIRVRKNQAHRHRQRPIRARGPIL